MATFSNFRPESDELTLLAIGDVHLGTRPRSLPSELEALGVDPRALTPEAALESLVDEVLALPVDGRVDAVLFAGDVVESTNARFEALRPLERSVRRLVDAGIPVLAVVGNHDVEALPRLARMIPGFEVLGEGGRWQSRLIEKAGAPAVEILGWSFPEKRVRNSPVDGLVRNPIAPSRAGLTRIGLLHGDLDASGGKYAPITSTELTRSGLDAWLLGHIHKPSLPDWDANDPGGSPPASSDDVGPRGYLGSLVGLDPSETGAHGPWLVRVTKQGRVETRQLAIAPLRWDRFDVLVDPASGPEEVGDRLLVAAGRVASELHAQGIHPKVIGLRPCLRGPTECYEALSRRIADGRWNGQVLSRWVGDTFVFVDKVLNHLELAHDLAELARGNDPPALLARKLLVLEAGGSERDALIEDARRALQCVAGESHWSVLAEERGQENPLDDDAVVRLLSKSGTAALSLLLSQIAPESAIGSDS